MCIVCDNDFSPFFYCLVQGISRPVWKDNLKVYLPFCVSVCVCAKASCLWELLVCHPEVEWMVWQPPKYNKEVACYLKETQMNCSCMCFINWQWLLELTDICFLHQIFVYKGLSNKGSLTTRIRLSPFPHIMVTYKYAESDARALKLHSVNTFYASYFWLNLWWC